MPGPLLGRDSLWFDSCKRPPPVSDHSVFAFWVVAYDRFDCSSVRPRQREKTFDGTFHVSEKLFYSCLLRGKFLPTTLFHSRRKWFRKVEICMSTWTSCSHLAPFVFSDADHALHSNFVAWPAWPGISPACPSCCCYATAYSRLNYWRWPIEKTSSSQVCLSSSVYLHFLALSTDWKIYKEWRFEGVWSFHYKSFRCLMSRFAAKLLSRFANLNSFYPFVVHSKLFLTAWYKKLVAADRLYDGAKRP